MSNAIVRTLIAVLSPFTVLVMGDPGLSWHHFTEGQVMLWCIAWSFAWMFVRDHSSEQKTT